MLEEPRQASRSARGVEMRHVCGRRKPIPHVRASCRRNTRSSVRRHGTYTLRIPAFQRIVKVVGQQHRLELALPQDLLRPVRRTHLLHGRVVKGLPVVERDVVVREPKERLRNVDEPAVLNRVLQRLEMRDQSPHFFARIEIRHFDVLLGHAGRVGQFRVVVIAQDVRQRAGCRLMRIDVRMRIDQHDRIEFVEQPLPQRLRHATLLWAESPHFTGRCPPPRHPRYMRKYPRQDSNL